MNSSNLTTITRKDELDCKLFIQTTLNVINSYWVSGQTISDTQIKKNNFYLTFRIERNYNNQGNRKLVLKFMNGYPKEFINNYHPRDNIQRALANLIDIKI